MKLSIIVIFCDRDKKFYPLFVERVQDNVTVEHELIVVDNTSDGSLRSICGAFVVRGGVDKGIFQSRRLGCECVTGEYVWFCDGDDDVLKLTKFEYDTDMVSFNYLCRLKDDPKDYPCKNPYPTSCRVEADFYHWFWKDKCRNMVWNKFFRRSLLLKIYDAVPAFEMYTSEDTLLCLFFEMLASSVYFEQRAFYRYYKNVGSSEGEPFGNVEQLKRTFRGTKEGWSVYNAMTTTEQRKASGIETELILVNLCKYALKQASRCKKFMPEFVAWLCEYFSKDYVQEVLEAYHDEFDADVLAINDYMDEVK